MSETLTPTAAAVLECLTACDRPMKRGQIYKADDTIESEEAVSRALIELRSAGRVKRQEGGTYTLTSHDESAPNPAPEEKKNTADKQGKPRSKSQIAIDYAAQHGPVTAAAVRQALGDSNAAARLNQAAAANPPRIERVRGKDGVYLYGADYLALWSAVNDQPDQQDNAENSAQDAAEAAEEQPPEPAQPAPSRTPAAPSDSTNVHIRDVALWHSGQLVIAAEVDGNDTTLTFDRDNATRLIHYLDRIAEPG